MKRHGDGNCGRGVIGVANRGGGGGGGGSYFERINPRDVVLDRRAFVLDGDGVVELLLVWHRSSDGEHAAEDVLPGVVVFVGGFGGHWRCLDGEKVRESWKESEREREESRKVWIRKKERKKRTRSSSESQVVSCSSWQKVNGGKVGQIKCFIT